MVARGELARSCKAQLSRGDWVTLTGRVEDTKRKYGEKEVIQARVELADFKLVEEGE